VVKAPTIGEIKKQTKNFLRILDEFPEFRFIGDPVLRKKTAPVSLKEGLEIGLKLEKLLLSYRKITGSAEGLAAPQIGLGKSVFIVRLDGKIEYFINPKIVSKAVHGNYSREFCISCGLVWPDVKRPETITIQWKDNAGNSQEKEFTGQSARLVQHEFDHLLGIPNIDRAERGTIEICSTDPSDEKLRPNL
jgi:peptide deformylase